MEVDGIMPWLCERDPALELAVAGGEEAQRLSAELPAIPAPRADLTTTAGRVPV